MNKQIFKSILILLSIALSLCIFISRVSKTNQKTNININEVPYISTYYINPIISPNEDVIIDFYVTDFSRSEYTSDDYSNKFTITIKIDGKKSIVKKNVKAGDNSINIGKFSSLGEQNFSIYCTDSYNRSSHELFNSFLVKDTITYNEYIMTIDDLNKYNISNSDNINNAINTGEGLQKLLDDTYKSGYNKDDAIVAKTAIAKAHENNYDVVLIDTAGRMHNNGMLMSSLSKIIRMNTPDHIVYVGEALTGNDSLNFVEEFNKYISNAQSGRIIDSIILTKIDTVDKKLGQIFNLTFKAQAPILFLGCGQTNSDLIEVDPDKILDLLLN